MTHTDSYAKLTAAQAAWKNEFQARLRDILDLQELCGATLRQLEEFTFPGRAHPVPEKEAERQAQKQEVEERLETFQKQLRQQQQNFLFWTVSKPFPKK